MRKLQEVYETADLTKNRPKWEYLKEGKEEHKGANNRGAIFNKKGKSEDELGKEYKKTRAVLRSLNSLF